MSIRVHVEPSETHEGYDAMPVVPTGCSTNGSRKEAERGRLRCEPAEA